MSRPQHRPQKNKVTRATVDPTDKLFVRIAIDHLARLSVDPTMSEELADIGYAAIICGTASKEQMEFVGIFTAHILKDASIDAIKEYHCRILNMRKEHDKHPRDKGRNWNFLRGYLDYLAETNGRIPTKKELTEYLIARTDKYFNLPSASDGKGWTRMRKDCGLIDLIAKRTRH